MIQKSGDEIDRLRDLDEKIANEDDRKKLMADLERVMSETQAFAARAKKQLDEVKTDNDKFAADPANDNSARKEMRYVVCCMQHTACSVQRAACSDEFDRSVS